MPSAERNTADSPRRLLSDKSPPFNPVRPALGGPAQNHRDVPYSLNHQAALRAYGHAVELRFLCFDSFKGRGEQISAHAQWLTCKSAGCQTRQVLSGALTVNLQSNQEALVVLALKPVTLNTVSKVSMNQQDSMWLSNCRGVSTRAGRNGKYFIVK